jgi:hypothetical protein
MEKLLRSQESKAGERIGIDESDFLARFRKNETRLGMTGTDL